MIRGSSQVPPESGIRPILTKAWVKRASSAAIRMSQAAARDTPAPAATPFTAAITGFGVETTTGISRWYDCSRCSRMSGRSPARYADSNSVRSWPAQKPRPAPVTTMARASSSSRTEVNTSRSSSDIIPVIAFSLSGRFRVVVSTQPARALMDHRDRVPGPVLAVAEVRLNQEPRGLLDVLHHGDRGVHGVDAPSQDVDEHVVGHRHLQGGLLPDRRSLPGHGADSRTGARVPLGRHGHRHRAAGAGPRARGAVLGRAPDGA